MSTPLFLDCEFTSLEKPRLLSLALYGAQGNEFYVELDSGGRAFASLRRQMGRFTKTHVAPQLGKSQSTALDLASLGSAVCAWLLPCSKPVDVAYDYHTDFDLLESALVAAGAWEGLKDSLVPVHVAYLWGDPDAVASAEASWAQSEQQTGLRRHHALADARALAAAYRTVHGT